MHRLSNRETSITLAFLFFLNVYYSSVYSVFLCMRIVVIERRKYDYTSVLQRQLDPILSLVFILIEYIRLSSGQKANINEQVSRLAACMLLSFFTLPITVYLGYYQGIKFPVDSMFASCSLILSAVELGVSFVIIRKIIRSKTMSFYSICRQLQEEQLRAL